MKSTVEAGMTYPAVTKHHDDFYTIQFRADSLIVRDKDGFIETGFAHAQFTPMLGGVPSVIKHTTGRRYFFVPAGHVATVQAVSARLLRIAIMNPEDINSVSVVLHSGEAVIALDDVDADDLRAHYERPVDWSEVDRLLADA